MSRFQSEENTKKAMLNMEFVVPLGCMFLVPQVGEGGGGYLSQILRAVSL